MDIPRTIGTHALGRQVGWRQAGLNKQMNSFALPRSSCVYIGRKHAVAAVGTVANRASADTVGSPCAETNAGFK